jgi:hypothetical protein
MRSSITVSDTLGDPAIDFLFNKRYATRAEMDGLRKFAVTNESVDVLSAVRDAFRRTQLIETKKFCRHGTLPY